MREIAVRLKTIPVQILEHAYHYEAFGSWWFTFMSNGEKYRMVYDGKETCIRLEKNVSLSLNADWQSLSEVQCEETTSKSVIEKVLTVINPE